MDDWAEDTGEHRKRRSENAARLAAAGQRVAEGCAAAEKLVYAVREDALSLLRTGGERWQGALGAIGLLREWGWSFTRLNDDESW